MTSIHQVILDGRLSQLNFLVKRFSSNVNERDSYGRTPLHLAALCDQENYGFRVARLLLQGNADLNLTDSQHQTSFVYACLLNRSKLITLFIQSKMIDWQIVDHESFLPIHHAAASCETSSLAEIIQEMKTFGLSVDTKTDLGYTPLILAIKSTRFDNAIYLLDHTEASPFAIDDEFHYTCQQWAQSVGPKSSEWSAYHHRTRHLLPKRSRSIDKSIPNYKCFYGVESPYQCRMLICNHHHTKTFEESTFTPAIFSPRVKDSKLVSNITEHDKESSKVSYQMWMHLVQRLHDRTLSMKNTLEPLSLVRVSSDRPINPSRTLRRNHTWVGRESVSPWITEKLSSTRQVTQLINHYSNMLSVDNKEALTQSFNDRPKSILRPIGSANKYRFTKEVTFAAN